MTEVLSQVPAWFWALIGTLILSNIGAIASLATFIFKAGQFVANTNSGIKDAKDTGVRAHLRIDKIETSKELS